MQLEFRAPRDPELRGVVRALWHCADPVATGVERMLPSGEMQLIVNLHEDALRFADATGQEMKLRSGALIQGMQSRAVLLDRRDQRDVLGVVFAPGAGRAVLGLPLDAVANDHVDLDELGRQEVPLREHLLEARDTRERFDRVEQWLRARLRGSIDPAIRAALHLMRQGLRSVGELASTVGVSERSLRRRFRAEVGLPPKQMSRVLRLQRALEGLRGPNPLCEVALAAGYHDQAHFNHEVRALAGVSPSAYRQHMPVHRNHLS